MFLNSIQALGNTLLRTQLEADVFSGGHKIANCILLPLHGFIGHKSYKIENKKLEALPPSNPLWIYNWASQKTLNGISKTRLGASLTTLSQQLGLPLNAYLSKTYKIVTLIALIVISRTRFTPYLKDLTRWYMITVATVTMARAGILFLSKVSKVSGTEGNTSALVLIFNSNKAQTNLVSRLQSDTEFFQTLTTKFKTSTQETLKWLKEQQKNGYSYPFYVADLIEKQSSTFPIEAQAILAKHGDYLKAYNDFLAVYDPELHDKDFGAFLNEKDSENCFQKFLSDFLVSTPFQQSAESLTKTN